MVAIGTCGFSRPLNELLPTNLARINSPGPAPKRSAFIKYIELYIAFYWFFFLSHFLNLFILLFFLNFRTSNIQHINVLSERLT